jgi:hypothetical protein
MGLDVIAFGIAWVAAAAANLILLAMIAEINRKSDEHSMMSYFRSSWAEVWEVWQEYTLLYPKGIYRFALMITVIISIAFALLSMYWRFGVLHR